MPLQDAIVGEQPDSATADALRLEPAFAISTSSSRMSALECAVKAAVARALHDDDAGGLLKILQIEPLTNARYLKVINSPLYGFRQKAGSAATALQLLGRRVCARIAMLSSFDCSLSRKRDGQLEGLRRHCLQTAVLARELTPAGGRSEEAFVAGLLHEIHGMLHVNRASVQDAGGAPGDSSLQSAALLRAWNLPDSIVDAIAEHGRALQTGLAPAGGVGAVLWIAHRFAHRVDGGAQIDASSAGRIASTLGLNRKALDQAIAAARIRYESLVVKQLVQEER